MARWLSIITGVLMAAALLADPVSAHAGEDHGSGGVSGVELGAVALLAVAGLAVWWRGRTAPPNLDHDPAHPVESSGETRLSGPPDRRARAARSRARP